ncbi:hypothetical protein F4808DRAFT_463241 [Astrocystis sublimbata]|nr:hypothetical protein F4808DRAFT_463241 [Astrocystis sublimbata]
MQSKPLPVALSRILKSDNKYAPNSPSRARELPQYPFKPLLQAAEVAGSGTDFSQVDIVANRYSLTHLLDFCSDNNEDEFCLNMRIINNTLFINGYGKFALNTSGGKRDRKKYGQSFEKTFTKLPEGFEDAGGYYHALQYKLGDLNCVVSFQVDALYQGGETGSADHLIKVAPQCMAAELKTTFEKRELDRSMPQLWFGRTPWLITGWRWFERFYRYTVVNVQNEFADWERRYQDELGKLVSLLSRLREAVRRSGAKQCKAVCMRQSSDRSLQIYRLKENDEALPEELIHKFWPKDSDEAKVENGGLRERDEPVS